MDARAIRDIVKDAASLIQYCDNIWVDYDREADVLYVSFSRPPHETDSELTDGDILLSYSGDRLVGVTVLHASTRIPSLAAK
jgi:uncharacterized protein YuzE